MITTAQCHNPQNLKLLFRQKLEEIYGHPANIDLWVGGVLVTIQATSSFHSSFFWHGNLRAVLRANIKVLGLEVSVPKWHFPGTGNFPEKSGKFPIPSIREHPLPGPDLVPAFGTALSPVSFKVGKHSGIPERFPN